MGDLTENLLVLNYFCGHINFYHIGDNLFKKFLKCCVGREGLAYILMNKWFFRWNSYR